MRKHLSPHVSGNPTQPQRVGATQPRRVGDHGFSKHIPDARAVSLGGHECFSSSPPAPCVTFAKAGPGRGQGPLMAASLQVPSSSPTSLPWPSRASRCSTLSSPLASACAGAASGCGRPSRPTWVAWVRGPRAPRLQLLCGVGAGLCSSRQCTPGGSERKVQGSRARRSPRQESSVTAEPGVRPRAAACWPMVPSPCTRGPERTRPGTLWHLGRLGRGQPWFPESP